MPIQAENRDRYPDDWARRSKFVRFIRARGQCEWVENGQRCPCRHGEISPLTGSRVILTTAHLYDMRPEAASLLNLGALCQLHHLALDRYHHILTAARNRRRRSPQVDLVDQLEEAAAE